MFVYGVGGVGVYFLTDTIILEQFLVILLLLFSVVLQM